MAMIQANDPRAQAKMSLVKVKPREVQVSDAQVQEVIPFCVRDLLPSEALPELSVVHEAVPWVNAGFVEEHRCEHDCSGRYASEYTTRPGQPRVCYRK
jgi:hypothetical protein